MRRLVALPLLLRSLYSRISTVNHRFLLLCGESVQICVSIGLRVTAPGSRFKLVTTPTETCPICGGTGWQTIERGREREVIHCACRVQGRAERLLAAAKIPAHYRHCDLSSFKYDPDDKTQKSIVEARIFAGRFVEEYPIQKKGMMFVGSAGVGKTHLAIGIIRELMRERGTPCLFCDYRDLLKSIQDSYNPSVQVTEMQLLRPVLDIPVLLLDDLAAIRSSEWIFDTVNYILNSRYNRDGTTIITTNFPDEPEEANVEFNNLQSKAVVERIARGDTLGDRIGHRMWSRLHEMCTKIEMEGPDHRQGPNKARFEKRGGPARLSLGEKRRPKDSAEIEEAILTLIQEISGNRRGNQLRGWRRLIEATGVKVGEDIKIISAFERLLNSGYLRLSTMGDKQYFGTESDRDSFFSSLFVAALTPEGADYYKYIKKQKNEQQD